MKSPELILVIAVINQAIKEAMYDGWNKYYIIDKRRAIELLSGNSIDFRTICHYADIDPERACRKFTAAMKLDLYALRDDQNRVLSKPRKEYKHKGKYRLTFNEQSLEQTD